MPLWSLIVKRWSSFSSGKGSGAVDVIDESINVSLMLSRALPKLSM